MDESEVARRANEASYATRDAVNGSPHLNHKSVWSIYNGLVTTALISVGAKPRVLELGAGSGEASVPWIEAGALLTAVDCSGEQLRRLRLLHPSAITVEMDNSTFLREQNELFDVVSVVSTLHHIPDYLGLLRECAAALRPGGALLTFQDPLRYDRLSIVHTLGAQILYVPWRLSGGNIRAGVRNRLRRARGVFLADDPSDQDEYHVVRNGVDSQAIVEELAARFAAVEVVTYFSSQARLSQWLGERLRLRSTFGLLATGRLRGPTTEV
jgi:2-polyprenyl-3-methyl-5-hydroxy-6-metoxy-1,4-benzoquinol methylase